ncbi:MAG TPA: hypothetical protein VFF73_15430, partial [Planctomycetota bacterium]|nr:hypothetical protein [Planctomycetota bacterium]
MTARLLAALAPLLVAGCSTVDLDALGTAETAPDVAKVRADLKGKGQGYKLYVAPVAVVCSEDFYLEDPTGSISHCPRRYGMHVNRERLHAEIQECLKGVFDVAEVSGGSILLEANVPDDVALERARRRAYEKGCDLILLPRVTRFDAVFVDTTGAWWANALFLHWYFYFPVLAIADEIYGSQAQIVFTVESVRNDRPIEGLTDVPVVTDSLATDSVGGEDVARGPRVFMDDLDRGPDLMGTYFPGRLDKDQWAAHVQPIMERYVWRDLGKRLARTLAERFDAFRDDQVAQTHALAATYGVVVGVRDYPRRTCELADRDANAFAAWLEGEPVADDPLVAGVRASRKITPSKLVTKLLNAQATGPAVLAAVRAAVEASHPDDTIVFYFAGRGRSRGAQLDQLDLVLADDGEGKTRVTLKALAEELGKASDRHARTRVVVLDTTFGTGARGSEATQAVNLDQVVGLERLASGAGAVVVASRDAAPANVLQVAMHGLLT